jgi:hypothetical protein
MTKLQVSPQHSTVPPIKVRKCCQSKKKKPVYVLGTYSTRIATIMHIKSDLNNYTKYWPKAQQTVIHNEALSPTYVVP